MSKERYTELKEEDDIRLDTIREDHRREDYEEGDDNNKSHAMRWEVYVKNKEGFIKREFLVSIPNTRGGGIVWTCVKDNII